MGSNEIEKIISKRLEKSIVSSPRFVREHIFYDLKKMINTKYDQNTLMDMYYYFSVYEKIFNFARSGNLLNSKYWIDKISSKQELLLPEIKTPLDILYLPAIAYYEYKIKDKEKALFLLDKELGLIKSYLSDYDILRIEHLIEQSINKIRVYWTFKEYSKFREASKKLLLFVFSNIPDDKIFVGESIHELKNNNLQNYHDSLEYIVDSIFDKIINNDSFSLDEKRKMMIEIMIPLFEQSNLFAFKNKILSLQYFVASKKDEFKETLQESLKDDEIFPSSLKFLLLSVYFDNLPIKNNDTVKLFNRFFKEILGYKVELY